MPAGMRTFPDERATHFWDGQAVLTAGYPSVLGFPNLSYGLQRAWDVYFIFGPQAKWTGTRPPKPDFWMHQTSSAGTLAPRLRPVEFALKAEELLRPCIAAAPPPAGEPTGKEATTSNLRC